MTRPTFPRSIPEFYAMFPDEESAFRFIFDARWPDGWACSKCGHDRCYGRTDRHGTECAGCGYVGSIGPEYDELYSGDWVHPNPGRKAAR